MKNRISELRKEKNITTTELAKQLNVTIRSVQRYEIGSTNPPPDKLKLMAEIFNCSIDYILYLSDKRTHEALPDGSQLEGLIKANPDTKKLFINRLKDLLIEKEVTKDVLSKSTGIDKESISGYLKGTIIPDIDALKKIAKNLDTTIDYLFGLNDNPSSSEIVLLEDWISFNDGKSIKKVPAKLIRDFLNSISQKDDI
ncbi:MAG: helix-turn-helix transcriptional regulator [Clostridiales bacterium]